MYLYMWAYREMAETVINSDQLSSIDTSQSYEPVGPNPAVPVELSLFWRLIRKFQKGGNLSNYFKISLMWFRFHIYADSAASVSAFNLSNLGWYP